jgi:hypothetical protein
LPCTNRPRFSARWTPSTDTYAHVVAAVVAPPGVLLRGERSRANGARPSRMFYE